MSRDTLIDAIKDLLIEWQELREALSQINEYEADQLQDCIDDLKGILPPEE